MNNQTPNAHAPTDQHAPSPNGIESAKSSSGAFLNALFAGYEGGIRFVLNEEVVESSDPAFVMANDGQLRVLPITDDGVFFLFAAQDESEKDAWKDCRIVPTAVLWRDGVSLFCWAFDGPVSPDNADLARLIAHFQMVDIGEPIPMPGTDGWELVHVNHDAFYELAKLVQTSVPKAVEKEPQQFYRDAKCITPYNDLDYEGRDIIVSIGTGIHCKDWKPTTMPVGGLMYQLSQHEIGKKEGLSIVLGDMVPGQRKKTTVKSCTAIGLDIDVGYSGEFIDKRLAKLGCLAIRYTTNSHNKTSSDIAKDKVLRHFAGEHRITTEMMREYLRDKERWLSEIVDSVEYVEDDQTEQGIVCRVSHIPMAKHRVIIPLDKPFVIRDEGRLQQEAMAKWKKVVEAMATHLDLVFDKACTDTSRLFYLPRHKKDRPFEISLFGGPLFDWHRLNLESQFERIANEFKDNKKSKSVTPEGKNLGKWWGKFAHGFQIMDVIDQYAPDRIRSKASSGSNIECPFDENHSNAADPNDQACFAVNAADGPNEFFVVKCQHEGCQDKTALDMLGKMLKDDWFPYEVLEDLNYNIVDFSGDEEVQKAQQEKAKQAHTINEGYGNALAFEPKSGPFPKGVTYDKETNSIHKTFRNSLLLIGQEGWDLGYNELTQNYAMRGEVTYPWPEHLGVSLNDAIRREIRLYLLRRWGVTFSSDDIYEATMTLARRNTFNPVCDYMAEVEPNWDGAPRVERWLETYMGVKVEDNCKHHEGANEPCEKCDHRNYVRAIGKIVLIAAVRRARQPGCKFDEMMILEGPQGGGKSTAIRILGGEYFSDANLGDLTKKEAAMKLRGVWIQEMGELAALRKAEVDELKEFLAYVSDKYKIPYAKTEEDFLRRCIIIGTVNPGGGAYLIDLTGNRRFWPVKCGDIDLEALAKDRDQLWAEAATMESRGDSIRLDPSLYRAAKAEQDARLADDPWVELLAEYLDSLKPEIGRRVLSMKLLSDALQIPADRQNQTATKKLKGAMAQIPTWEYKASMRTDGVKSAGYEYVGLSKTEPGATPKAKTA